MPTNQQRLAMSILNELEKKHGAEYLNTQPTDALTNTLKAFKLDFQRAERVVSPHHVRPGVSGVYRSGGRLTQRSSLERKGVLDPSKPPSSEQLRMNIAHIRTSSMKRHELATHPHPDVQRLYQAINPHKEKMRKDTAVVWTSDDKPFYIFGRITKPVHRTSMGKDYNILFPRAYDYRGGKRTIPLNRLDDYGRWTKWYNVMRSKDLFKLTRSHEAKPIVLKGNFDTVIRKAQEIAWDEAKDFYNTYQDYKKSKAAVEALRKMYRLPTGEHKQMPPEHKKVHDIAWGVWQAAEDKLKGITPNHLKGEAAEEHRKRLSRLGDSYTWYLWLLAAENQYGVRLPERQKLPENAKYPHVINPVQPQPQHWTIQPTGREEIPRWEADVLRGIGFSPADFRSFEVALQKSGYKLGYQGNKAITHLWVPLTGELINQYGLDVSPPDISDYVKDANKQHSTDYVVGRTGNKVDVQHDLPIPQYKFNGGNPRREFSLIPAIDYLRYFDSPKHGGARLVHGQRFFEEPPKRSRTKADDASRYSGMSRKTRERSQSYQMRKYGRSGISPRFAYDMERVRADREKIAREIADRMLQQPIKDARAAVSIRSKILQRQNLSTILPGRRDVTHIWRAPERTRGFIHSKSGMWELPTTGPVMKTKRHPVTGQLMRVRRQPIRKRYVIRSTGFRPAKKPVPVTKYEFHAVPRQAIAPTWEEYWESIISRPRNVTIDGETYTTADVERHKNDYKREYDQRLRAFIRKAHSKGFIVIDGTDDRYELTLEGNTITRVERP
jgi:hypothetical protein